MSAEDADMKKMKIVFMPLFDLTQVYAAVASELEDEFDIYWVTTQKKYFDYIVSAGFDESRVKLLNFQPESLIELKDCIDRVREVENSCDLNYFQVQLMDRFLTNELPKSQRGFVTNTFVELDLFLGDVSPDVAFLEPTNVTDLLMYMLCENYEVQVLRPADFRLPAGRMGVFSGYLQKELFSKQDLDDTHFDCDKYLDDFRKEFFVPYNFDALNKKNNFDLLYLLKRIVRNLGALRKSDISLTRYNPIGRLKVYFLSRARIFIMNNFKSYVDLADVPGKIVFYPLHVQPEASIDVLGDFFSDQIKFIKDLRRVLPVGYTLVIKEHPNFLGSKSLSFFNEIDQISGVDSLNYKVPSKSILEKSSVVVTISGTAAFQAGLLGIPSAVFTPLYFDSLSTVRYCRNFSDFITFLDLVESGLAQDLEVDKEVMSKLYEESFKGYWTDSYFDKSVLNKDNIKNISSGFRRAIYKACDI